MADRYFDPTSFSLERNVVRLYAKVTFGASGAITLVTTLTNLPAGAPLARLGSPSKGFLSATKSGTGLYTFVLGGPQIQQFDTYYKILDVCLLWDETSNSGTPPLAPLYSLHANAVATANVASFAVQCTSSAGTATNPASGEAAHVEIIVANSNMQF